jgi:TadE-like protein
MPRRRLTGDEGSVVEAAIVIPAAMLVILLSVQVCLWAHASTLVQAAATQGDQAACIEGGSLASGIAEARSALAETANEVVVNPSVDASLMPGDQVEVRVTGFTESIVPGVHFAVSAVRVGSRQEFRAGN